MKTKYIEIEKKTNEERILQLELDNLRLELRLNDICRILKQTRNKVDWLIQEKEKKVKHFRSKEEMQMYEAEQLGLEEELEEQIDNLMYDYELRGLDMDNIINVLLYKAGRVFKV